MTSQGKDNFMLYFNTENDPNPSEPFKRSHATLVDALTEAWANQIVGQGRSLSIDQNNKTIFNEEELKEAFRRMAALRHTGGNEHVWAYGAIQEMGKGIE